MAKSTTGDRYDHFLKRVGAEMGDDARRELDELVGERMARAQDDAANARLHVRLLDDHGGQLGDEVPLDRATTALRQGMAAIEAVAKETLAIAAETEATSPCACDGYGRDPRMHDELLAFEARGVEGVNWLLEYLEDDLTMEHDPNTRVVDWLEFPRFVSEHNWQDPLIVSRLAAEFDAFLRLRHGYQRAAHTS